MFRRLVRTGFSTETGRSRMAPRFLCCRTWMDSRFAHCGEEIWKKTGLGRVMDLPLAMMWNGKKYNKS